MAIYDRGTTCHRADWRDPRGAHAPHEPALSLGPPVLPPAPQRTPMRLPERNTRSTAAQSRRRRAFARLRDESIFARGECQDEAAQLDPHDPEQAALRDLAHALARANARLAAVALGALVALEVPT